jgi:hypothetical protein
MSGSSSLNIHGGLIRLPEVYQPSGQPPIGRYIQVVMRRIHLGSVKCPFSVRLVTGLPSLTSSNTQILPIHLCTLNTEFHALDAPQNPTISLTRLGVLKMDPALEMRFAQLVLLLVGYLDLSERDSGRKGRITDESMRQAECGHDTV